MKKTLNPLLDPRGLQERPILKLAPRPTLAELKKGKILFYNNTKLDFCNYGETFVRIKERFREMGITNFVDYKETVRGKGSKVLEDYAAMLAKEKPTAAVVALGDMGTSPATCIVTIALEKLGIPSVYITAPPGGELVEGVAVYRAGNLCLCKIDIYQASTRKEVREQIDLKWDYIIDSLTAKGEKLEESGPHRLQDGQGPAREERPSAYHRQDRGLRREALRARLLHGRDHGVLRRRAHRRRSAHHPPDQGPLREDARLLSLGPRRDALV